MKQQIKSLEAINKALFEENQQLRRELHQYQLKAQLVISAQNHQVTALIEQLGRYEAERTVK